MAAPLPGAGCSEALVSDSNLSPSQPALSAAVMDEVLVVHQGGRGSEPGLESANVAERAAGPSPTTRSSSSAFVAARSASPLGPTIETLYTVYLISAVRAGGILGERVLREAFKEASMGSTWFTRCSPISLVCSRAARFGPRMTG